MKKVEQGHFTPIRQDNILNKALKRKQITSSTKGLGGTIGVTRA